MLLFILDLFQRAGIKIPFVFSYFSTRMLLAAMTSLILTIFLGPFFIRKLYELKIGQVIRGKDECPLLAELHSKKKDTPTMGGILILCSILISMLLWMDLSSSFSMILLIVTIYLGALGASDDYLKLKKKNSKGLRPKFKLLAQIFLASALAFYLINFDKEIMYKLFVPFLKDPFSFGSLGAIFLFLFFVFVIIGSSNAVNLTDGLDGLAAGCLILVAVVLSVFGFLSNNTEMAKYLNIIYIEGSGEVSVFLFALVGACLGFLWYNGHPAQVFMGDTGSLALGGAMGVCAILLRREILLGIIGGIFVMEALSVILQVWSYKYRNKKRIFLCSPLHHHFEYLGWSETKVVLRFWIIGLLLAIIGIASIKFQ